MNNLLAQIKLQPTGQFSQLGNVTVENIISASVTLVLIVAAVVFFFMLVIGGIKWITSGGDKAATEGARSQITAALVGLVIVFAAWAIITLIGNLFGITIFNQGLNLPNFTGSTSTGGAGTSSTTKK